MFETDQESLDIGAVEIERWFRYQAILDHETAEARTSIILLRRERALRTNGQAGAMSYWPREFGFGDRNKKPSAGGAGTCEGSTSEGTLVTQL